ncbi:hypothetical protein NESM_000550900 [Novymonas esmeraldas]|uniref:Uncharacterized protein n=1 Tax=Novymonas esmeraldas TaxID=1808958 RepID=A0AAW0ERZ9_9TRYP
MSAIEASWAVQSILQLGHHHLRHSAATVSASPAPAVTSKTVRVSAMPRLMRASDDASRVLLLAKRPTGIAGVALRAGGPVRWTGLPTTTPPSRSPTPVPRKTRLLASYLQRHGFPMVPAAPASTHGSLQQPPPAPPLLLHTNHLIGWKLNDASAAFPVYAHTLVELQRLRSRDVATLQPQHCLIASEYCEWDNWREVLGEPGWDFFSADDVAVERLLRGGLTDPIVRAEAGLYPVDLL